METRMGLGLIPRIAGWGLLIGALGVARGAPPNGFIDEQVLGGIDSPSGFKFSPDGRLFFSERVLGALRTATYDAGLDQWIVDAQPYATFDVPVDENGMPTAHRSSGLRDFAFDPDFATNGYIYVFYMKHNPRHNRLVRVQQGPLDERRALPGETLLMEFPFNSTASSGSHNGGAVDFGSDGTLYIATGDGWNGGANVQSLGTYTGKVYRINPDGTIPTDNPFYNQATGALRAIYCLGLRNPFSMTYNSATGTLYVNEANGPSKTNVLRVEAGANFGHQGFNGIGVERGAWHNTSISGGNADKLITGGAWYDGSSGTLPPEYDGRLFVCHWGSNGSPTGVINTVRSETDLTTERFADDVIKPVNIRIGPDGDLYYMYTTYQTFNGRVHRIRFTGASSVSAPRFAPMAGSYLESVTVTLSATTPDAVIRYTLDGSPPTEQSALYVAPIMLTESTTIRARGYAPDLAPSPIVEAFYAICADATCNQPPIANAGADRTVVVGEQAYLSGTASVDPDTDELLLVDGWRQVTGTPVALLNDDETVAYFTPTETGRYTFEYELADELSVSKDTVTLFVVPCLDRLDDGPIVAWRFDEGAGPIALDTARGSHHGTFDGPVWADGRTPDAKFAAAFDGIDDVIDLGFLDIDSEALTLSAWVQFDDFEQMDGRILSKASGVADDDHWWMLSTLAAGGDHVLRFRLKTTNGGTTTLIADRALSTGTWTHVAATYDGAAMRIWQDGILVGVTAKSGRVATDPVVPAAIGNQPERNRPLDGRVDDVLIFDRSLSDTEIEWLAAFYRPFDVDRNGMVDADDRTAFLLDPVDLDGDGLADANDAACLAGFLVCGVDYLAHVECTAGPDNPLDNACAGRDLDGDGDSDLRDAAILQRLAGRPCP